VEDFLKAVMPQTEQDAFFICFGALSLVGIGATVVNVNCFIRSISSINEQAMVRVNKTLDSSS